MKNKKISGDTDWGDFNEHATNLFPYHISKPVFNKKLSGNSNESPIDLSIDIDENKETITLKDSVPKCTKSLPRTDSIEACIDVDKQNDESSLKDSEPLTTKLIRPPGMSNVSWCWYQADMNPSCRTPSPDNGRDILMDELGKRDNMNDVELKDFRLKYAKTESKLPQKEIDYLRIQRKKYDDSDDRRNAKLFSSIVCQKTSHNVTTEVINDCISLESTSLSQAEIEIGQKPSPVVNVTNAHIIQNSNYNFDPTELLCDSSDESIITNDNTLHKLIELLLLIQIPLCILHRFTDKILLPIRVMTILQRYFKKPTGSLLI